MDRKFEPKIGRLDQMQLGCSLVLKSCESQVPIRFSLDLKEPTHGLEIELDMQQFNWEFETLMEIGTQWGGILMIFDSLCLVQSIELENLIYTRVRLYITVGRKRIDQNAILTKKIWANMKFTIPFHAKIKKRKRNQCP